MKLRPELVPQPLWGISAYRLLGRGAKWKAIRFDALDANRNRCSVCGAAGKLTCHEKWHYDEKSGIATLKGFAVHCGDCDAATHIGRASQQGSGDMAIAQLCRMNACTQAQAYKLFADAMTIWRRRNNINWKTAVAKELLTLYPALIVVHEREGAVSDE